MLFSRLVSECPSGFGMRCTSCMTPSTRMRWTSASSWGSKWMSDARSSRAPSIAAVIKSVTLTAADGSGNRAAASTLPVSDYAAPKMRAVCQRVRDARVSIEGRVVGEIGAGLCVLLGIARGDGAAEAARLAGKIARLRIFEDEAGRFDRSLLTIPAARRWSSPSSRSSPTRRRATGRASPEPRRRRRPSR